MKMEIVLHFDFLATTITREKVHSLKNVVQCNKNPVLNPLKTFVVRAINVAKTKEPPCQTQLSHPQSPHNVA